MKNKIYLLLILLLNFIFIGTANADSCNISSYPNELATVLNSQFTASYGSNSYTQNFNSPIQLNATDMDYVKFYLHYEIRKNTGSITNINMGATCSKITQPLEGYNADYTITYQDGSTASVTGEELNTICEEYVTTGGNATYYYQPNINTVHLYIIRDDGLYVPCDVDNNGNAICPIYGNHSYSAFRYDINLSEGENIPVSIGIITRLVPKCKTSEREIAEKQQETNNKLDNIDSTINSSNTSGGETAADDLKNNSAFQDNTGLSSIVTAPLSMINSLTSTCSPIRLPIPYLDTTIEVPCIGDLLTSKMGELMQLVKVVINGYICYLIGLDMFKIVKHARDPNDDRIEVLDL